MQPSQSVLPDVLKEGLLVVFCGTAVGPRSAQLGEYYAGRGNQFWNVLARIGLTPRRLAPREYHLLPEYGIGLTDLAKSVSGADSIVAAGTFDVDSFRSKIVENAPKAIAFNGKRSAEALIDHHVDYGRQPKSIGATAVFVLPSTSGAARRYWDERHWDDLADFVLSH